MRRRYGVTCVLLAWMLLAAAPFSYAQTNAKKKVNSPEDLPRFSYPIKGTATELLLSDDATFNEFVKKVRADIESMIRDYDIQDKSMMRNLLDCRAVLQEIAGEYSEALKTVDAIRALEEKPAAKLMSGLSSRAMLQAAMETNSTSGAAFEQAYAKHYGEAIRALPWDVVQENIKHEYTGTKFSTKELVLGDVLTNIEPEVKKSGGLTVDAAVDLIGTRLDIQIFLPLAHAEGEILKEYIAAHNTPKPDIWAAREVTLTKEQKLTPVLVAILDSGIDLTLFPEQTFTDPNPTASGTHGLAFDNQGNPSTSWLYPLTPEQLDFYPEFRDEVKGFQDLDEGVDSPEAEATQKKFSAMSAEQLGELNKQQEWLSFYIHGTHCAGIAVRGNPAARLVVARFNDQLRQLPFPPTVEWAHRLGADFQQMSDYFRTRKVRVVNMSWADNPGEFETWLLKSGGSADPAERKKRAAELYAIWREAVETMIKSAPNTLFVAAAGNSNSNPTFEEDVPASLHLPNLITVGAVDQAGEETDFTSYGDTVVLDADGYRVESFVPGGARMKLSGTSMASPNVVNLAAKLIALDPSLTPVRVIELIKKGANTSEDGRRHLIDEKKSVALLLAGH
jgi:hypothetical protein